MNWVTDLFALPGQNLLPGIDFWPSALLIAALSLPAAFFLTRYTRVSGLPGFLLNAVLLALAGLASARLANHISLPFLVALPIVEKLVLALLGGFLLASFLLMLLFPRQRAD